MYGSKSNRFGVGTNQRNFKYFTLEINVIDICDLLKFDSLIPFLVVLSTAYSPWSAHAKNYVSKLSYFREIAMREKFREVDHEN